MVYLNIFISAPPQINTSPHVILINVGTGVGQSLNFQSEGRLNITDQKMNVINSIFFALQIDSVFETYDNFFNLSTDVKQKYAKKTGTTKNGWDELEREKYVYSTLASTILASINVTKPMNSPLCDCYTHTSKWLSKNDRYNHTVP